VRSIAKLCACFVALAIIGGTIGARAASASDETGSKYDCDSPSACGAGGYNCYARCYEDTGCKCTIW
jgi:hypothetical protein